MILQSYKSSFEKTHHSSSGNKKWPWNRVYVMNQNKHQELFRRTELQMIRVGMNPKHVRFSAVDGSKLGGREGIVELIRGGIVAPPCGEVSYFGLYSANEIAKYLTLRMIFKEALHLGYQQVLVMEDGLVFHSDFHSRLWEAWNELPAEWDIVYLTIDPNTRLKPYSERIAIPVGDENGIIRGLHAAVFRTRAMQSFMDLNFPITHSSDVLFGLLQTGKRGFPKLLTGYCINDKELIQSAKIVRDAEAEAEYSALSLGFYCKE